MSKSEILRAAAERLGIPVIDIPLPAPIDYAVDCAGLLTTPKVSKQGWHWVAAGFIVDGPEFNSHASSQSEAENEIRDAMLGTKYDRDDYTIMPVYTRAYQGSIDSMTPDTWNPDDGT